MARNLGRRCGRLLFHTWQRALPGLRLGSVASFSINLCLFIFIGPHESFPIRSFWGVEYLLLLMWSGKAGEKEKVREVKKVVEMVMVVKRVVEMVVVVRRRAKMSLIMWASGRCP